MNICHSLLQTGLFRHRVPDHGQFCAVAVLLILLLPSALFHLPDRGVYTGDRRHHGISVRFLRHAAVPRSQGW